VFTGAQIWDGFPDIDTDFDFTFTPSRIVYFWIFFVAANILWILLPLRLLVTAWRKSLKTSATDKRKKK